MDAGAWTPISGEGTNPACQARPLRQECLLPVSSFLELNAPARLVSFLRFRTVFLNCKSLGFEIRGFSFLSSTLKFLPWLNSEIISSSHSLTQKILGD